MCLDLGGGTGNLAEIASSYGGTWIVLDPSSKMLRQARQELTCIQAQGEHIPLENDSLDLITIRSALSYMDMTEAISECVRVLKPSGHLLLAEKVIGRFEDSYSVWYKAVSELRSPGKHVFSKLDIEKAVIEAGLAIQRTKEISRTYRMSFAEWLSRSGTIPAELQERLRLLFAQAPQGLEADTGVQVRDGIIRLCADWLILDAQKP